MMIKKAYRALCRKYHPDANINKPNAEAAAAKFTEVQQAYHTDHEREKKRRRRSRIPAVTEDLEALLRPGEVPGRYSLRMQAAANYTNSRHFREALNVLAGIPQRTAEWYYLSALANAGIGNNYAATEQAKTAASMDPSNPMYRNLVQQLSYGTYSYDGMSGNYGGPRGMGGCCTDFVCFSALCPCFNPFGCF